MILFSVIVIIIIYLIFLIGYFVFPSSWKGWYIKYMCKMLINVLGFTKVNINPEGMKRYQRLLESDQKVLIVANHRSLFDHFILLSVLDNISFLAITDGLIIPGLATVVRALNGIIIEKAKKNTTQRIIDNVKQRKENGNVLVVYPDGMGDILPGEHIAPFKTGAFVGRFDILPIVIKYKNYDVDPYYHYSKGETMFYSFFKKLIGTRCEVEIKILPLQKCSKNMSIERYRDKVHKAMSKEYAML